MITLNLMAMDTVSGMCILDQMFITSVIKFQPCSVAASGATGG